MRFLDIRRMVVQMVDLPAFVEQETGNTVKYSGTGSAKCLCPLHGDTDASFSMVLHDDGWGFHCFGCQESGTVVEFYKEYYGVDNSHTAIELICEKMGLNDEAEIVRTAIEEIASGELDIGKRIVDMHKAASYQCQSLIRMDKNSANVEWVNEAYREMNKAIQSEDYAILEMVYDRASEKIEDCM